MPLALLRESGEDTTDYFEGLHNETVDDLAELLDRDIRNSKTRHDIIQMFTKCIPFFIRIHLFLCQMKTQSFQGANIQALRVNDYTPDSHAYDPNGAELRPFYVNMAEILGTVDPQLKETAIWDLMLLEGHEVLPDLVHLGPDWRIPDPPTAVDPRTLVDDEADEATKSEVEAEDHQVVSEQSASVESSDSQSDSDSSPDSESDSESDATVPPAKRIRREPSLEILPELPIASRVSIRSCGTLRGVSTASRSSPAISVRSGATAPPKRTAVPRQSKLKSPSMVPDSEEEAVPPTSPSRTPHIPAAKGKKAATTVAKGPGKFYSFMLCLVPLVVFYWCTIWSNEARWGHKLIWQLMRENAGSRLHKCLGSVGGWVMIGKQDEDKGN
ncbi:hypothetical protein B0H13DRAFT_1929569 [Mycena leptocephala]|nr:hypothetical protein B0H13DRAFT_1929569 [Mycena leptocephala]